VGARLIRAGLPRGRIGARRTRGSGASWTLCVLRVLGGGTPSVGGGVTLHASYGRRKAAGVKNFANDQIGVASREYRAGIVRGLDSVFRPRSRPCQESQNSGSWHLFSPGTFSILPPLLSPYLFLPHLFTTRLSSIEYAPKRSKLVVCRSYRKAFLRPVVSQLGSEPLPWRLPQRDGH